MTVGELVEYLNQWEPDEGISVNVVDVPGRIRWGGDNLKIIVITDAPCPAIFFQLGEGEPFDEEQTRVPEECEKEAAANATE